MKKNKEFDCVEMKHKTAFKIQELLSGKSIEERLIFWQREYERMTAGSLEVKENTQVYNKFQE